MLPALSVHVPVTFAELLSGPPYVADVQPASPEVTSVPENATWNGLRYQPLASAARLALALVTTGGVMSILTVTIRLTSSPPPLTAAVQPRAAPMLSLTRV